MAEFPAIFVIFFCQNLCRNEFHVHNFPFKEVDINLFLMKNQNFLPILYHLKVVDGSLTAGSLPARKFT